MLRTPLYTAALLSALLLVPFGLACDDNDNNNGSTPDAGSPDDSFGGNGDGSVITPISTTADDSFYAVAVDGSDRIVAVGTADAGAVGQDFLVVRYTPNGTLDSSFGTDGVVTVDFGAGDDTAYAVAVQADGKIVVAGEARGGANMDFGVLRLNADGSLDSAAFNSAGSLPGTRRIDIANDDDQATGVAILANGGIALTGLGKGSTDDFMAILLTSAGVPDTSFDSDGFAQFDLGTGDADQASDVVTDGNDLLLGGYIKGGNGGENFGIIRVAADGTPVSTFGSNGVIELDISVGGENDRGMAIDIEGNYVVLAGWTGGGERVAVARFHKDTGALDADDPMAGRVGLDADGIVTPDLGSVVGTSFSRQEVRDMLIEPGTNKIILVGSVTPASGQSDDDLFIVRLTAAGAFDTSFDEDGVVVRELVTDNDDRAHGIALQSGRIVIVGTSTSAAGNLDSTVLRYNR